MPPGATGKNDLGFTSYQLYPATDQYVMVRVPDTDLDPSKDPTIYKARGEKLIYVKEGTALSGSADAGSINGETTPVISLLPPNSNLPFRKFSSPQVFLYAYRTYRKMSCPYFY
jgi:hypothetical protein